jgi:mannose/fructose-specific phosphotransferase system component IIA
MHPVPKSAAEALRIYRDPTSEDWERDYAAMLIGELDEGRDALLTTARDGTASEMLQQRAAECLANAWRDEGLLMTADVSGFTPVALQEMLFQRGEGPPSSGLRVE